MWQFFRNIGILRDLPRLIGMVQEGRLLEASALIVEYTSTEDDDRVVALLQELVTSEDPAIWIVNVLEIASIGVKYTDTEVDDELVGLLREAAESEALLALLDWIRETWLQDERPDVVMAAAGFPWQMILQLALFLFREWKERRDDD